MKSIRLVLAFLVSATFCACSGLPDFGEQYEKVVYILNSKEVVYYATLASGRESSGYITVYCGGTEGVSSDLSVSYSIDRAALDEFNKNEFGNGPRSFTLLPDHLVSFENTEVRIPKGGISGDINFKVNTDALDATKVYALPITISVPKGYELNPKMKTIIYILGVQNDYTGDYRFAISTTSVIPIGGTKTLKALNENQVMLPLPYLADWSGKPAEKYANYVIQVNPDNSLTLLPYMESFIEQVNGNVTHPNLYYPADPALNIPAKFSVCYRIKDKTGNGYIEVRETLTRM